MKKINISFSLFLVMMVLVAAPVFNSCNDSESGTDAAPEIHYIRVTDVDKSDSLVVGAFLGNTIALIGENLSDVKEIWFNDQAAYLNMAYITDFSIVVTIPTGIPELVTDQITLITHSGTQTMHPFSVAVPSPKLDGMQCEYVADGDDAVIMGNYFIDDANVPLQVFFPGNIEAEIKRISLKEIVVTVPEGAGIGPLTVKGIYGSSRSSFFFRDDRNVILDFDTKMGAGWRPGKTQSTAPKGIKGNYVALRGSLTSDWDWVEDDLAVELWGASAGLPEGPLFEGDPAKMVMKFEAYVVNNWSGGYMQLIFSSWSNANNSPNADDNYARGFWRPWESAADGVIKTDGWITVSVPLSDFKYDSRATKNDGALVYPDNCGSLTVFVWGPVPSACDVFICMDNVRIVPM